MGQSAAPGQQGCCCASPGAAQAAKANGTLTIDQRKVAEDLRSTYDAPEGENYVGQYSKDGKRHGRGVCDFANGSRYEGEYMDGAMHGQGMFRWSDGKRYVGQYNCGKRHGRGSCDFANGNRYEGECYDDLMHGEGTFRWSDGERYVGQYRMGKKHGRGAYYLVNGDVEVGWYEDGREHGQGVGWSSDRQHAWRLQDGVRGTDVNLKSALELSAELRLCKYNL